MRLLLGLIRRDLQQLEMKPNGSAFHATQLHGDGMMRRVTHVPRAVDVSTSMPHYRQSWKHQLGHGCTCLMDQPLQQVVNVRAKLLAPRPLAIAHLVLVSPSAFTDIRLMMLMEVGLNVLRARHQPLTQLSTLMNRFLVAGGADAVVEAELASLVTHHTAQSFQMLRFNVTIPLNETYE